MNEPALTLDPERLAGLLFELASQLHAERAHRLALEAALIEAGVLDRSALQRIAEDGAVRERARLAADEAVTRLMRVITEGADARTPLRAAGAPSTEGE